MVNILKVRHSGDLEFRFVNLKIKTRVCAVANIEGAQQTPKIWFFSPQCCIGMLKTKAQIARESIKNPKELLGPSIGLWTPTV